MRPLFALLALALPAAALAAGPLERNHPLVDKGMEAFGKNDFEGALRAFDEAKAALPDNALVEFNRGAALHKLGRNDEAKSALLRAAELDGKGTLAGPIHYNLGNVWAATGNKKEAVAEYRKALRADPADPLARHNLEVLLRDLQREPPKSNADGGDSDGGKSDAGRPDAGQDGGRPQDGGTPTDGGQKPDGGSPDGGGDGGSDGGQKGPTDGGRGDGGSGDGGSGEKPRAGDGGSTSDARTDGGSDAGISPDGGSFDEAEAAEMMDGGAAMSKKDAERLLDSMKNSEKNLQLWRFQQKRQRKPNGKDW